MEATSTLLTAIDLYKFSIHKIFLSSPLNSFYFVGTCILRRFLSFTLKTRNFEEKFVWFEADDQEAKQSDGATALWPSIIVARSP